MELVAFAHRLGAVTGLNTNGRRLKDAAFLNELIAAGLDHVQITLESHDPSIHDQMVAARGAWQDTVAGLAGAVERLPVTMFAFALSGITLMGLPPSSGFLAKWLIIEAALAQGHWIIAVVVLAGGLLAAVYVFRVLRQAFLFAPPNGAVAAVPRTLEWSAFALAAASVLLGLRGVELIRLLGAGT